MDVAIHALDALGLALSNHGHHWTERERTLYEQAIKILRANVSDNTRPETLEGG